MCIRALAVLCVLTSPLTAAPHDTSRWVGANYTPAYCVNAVQLWHDFRPDVIDKELAAASKYYGINTLRVYLHNINFDKEKAVLLANIEKFPSVWSESKKEEQRNDNNPDFVETKADVPSTAKRGICAVLTNS